MASTSSQSTESLHTGLTDEFAGKCKVGDSEASLPEATKPEAVEVSEPSQISVEPKAVEASEPLQISVEPKAVEATKAGEAKEVKNNKQTFVIDEAPNASSSRQEQELAAKRARIQLLRQGACKQRLIVCHVGVASEARLPLNSTQPWRQEIERRTRTKQCARPLLHEATGFDADADTQPMNLSPIAKTLKAGFGGEKDELISSSPEPSKAPPVPLSSQPEKQRLILEAGPQRLDVTKAPDVSVATAEHDSSRVCEATDISKLPAQQVDSVAPSVSNFSVEHVASKDSQATNTCKLPAEDEHSKGSQASENSKLPAKDEDTKGSEASDNSMPTAKDEHSKDTNAAAVSTKEDENQDDDLFNLPPPEQFCTREQQFGDYDKQPDEAEQNDGEDFDAPGEVKARGRPKKKAAAKAKAKGRPKAAAKAKAKAGKAAPKAKAKGRAKAAAKAKANGGKAAPKAKAKGQPKRLAKAKARSQPSEDEDAKHEAVASSDEPALSPSGKRSKQVEEEDATDKAPALEIEAAQQDEQPPNTSDVDAKPRAAAAKAKAKAKPKAKGKAKAGSKRATKVEAGDEETAKEPKRVKGDDGAAQPPTKPCKPKRGSEEGMDKVGLRKLKRPLSGMPLALNFEAFRTGRRQRKRLRLPADIVRRSALMQA